MSDRGGHSGEPSSAALEDLERRLRGLEVRVGRLEGQLGEAQRESFGEPAPALIDVPAAQLASALESPTSPIPIFGRALLGIAGAYFLRALTELGTLPLVAGVGLGIVYAAAWMGLAAKTPSNQRLEITVYSATSVLVLAPLIWEATVRFQALSTWVAAAVLAGFTILGQVVSWRKNVTVLVWIALLSGVFTAWVLLVATKDVLPFTLALLTVAAAVEVSACLEHWLPERWVAAGAVNMAVLLLTYLAVRKVLPEAYVALSAAAAPGVQVALLGIYLTSTIVRTLGRGFPFTLFETTQCAVAFVIGVGGALAAAEGSGILPLAMPAFTLLCGAACYVVSFVHLERRGRHDRNFYIYSAFGLLLMLAGTWLLLSGTTLVVVWSCLALACIVASGLGEHITLRWHGVLYLLLGAVASGVGLEAGRLLLGSGAGLSGVPAGGWVTAAAVVVCYATAMHDQRSAVRGRTHFGLSLAVSAILVWHAAGLTAGVLTGFYQSAAGPQPPIAYYATLRTAVFTLGSLLLVWGGLRWNKPEFARLGYPLMILGGYKLVVQDLHGDRTMALFLSLLLYGGSLVLIPRLLRQVRINKTEA
jgi:hypothetical protein